jgi:MFS superfamily sulfate permease-like transporter
MILRPEEPLFFANVTRILQEVRQAISTRKQLHTVIISMEESPDVDSTTVEALVDFAKIIENAGQKLIFVRMKDSAKEVLQRTAIKKSPNILLLDLSVDTAVMIASKV